MSRPRASHHASPRGSHHDVEALSLSGHPDHSSKGLGDLTNVQEQSHHAGQSTRKPAASTVLQPITPNSPRRNRTAPPKDSLKARSDPVSKNNLRGAHAIPLLAEDGLEYGVVALATSIPPNSKTDVDGTPIEMRRLQAHDRLKDMLSHVPSATPPLSHPRISGNKAKVTPRGTIQRSAPQGKPNSTSSTHSHATDTLGLQETRKPLRSRALSHLDLGDFVINPAANQGLDFAYSDVVRNRADRQCLPNCRDPACCGDQFRQLVAIAGFPTPPSPTNLRRTTSPSAVLDADKNMSRNAQIDHMLQRFGKHRMAHPRPASPPGFWRADMPTTQEAAADRAAADEVQRVKVAERYREAMRAGGRWKFRDE